MKMNDFKNELDAILCEHCNHDCNHCKFYDAEKYHHHDLMVCVNPKLTDIISNLVTSLGPAKFIKQYFDLLHKQIKFENPLDDMDDEFEDEDLDLENVVNRFYEFKVKYDFKSPNAYHIIRKWVDRPNECNKCPGFERNNEL